MNRETIIWLITATSLILIGALVFVGVMMELKWDFTRLSTVKFETNDYNIDEYYDDISVLTKTADISFEVSDDLKTSVICYEQENLKHSVEVKDGTLVIEVDDTRKWYEYIGINFKKPKITIHIPQREFGTLSIASNTGDVKIPKEFKFKSIDILGHTGDIINHSSVPERVKIKTTTGNIRVENISAGNIDLSVSTGCITVSDVICAGNVDIVVSTGKTYITNVKCKNLVSDGNTGDLSLNSVIATERFSIERDTGDVKFEMSDASEIFIETDTGDVKGSLLTDKIFITQTDTGRVSVPKTMTGGKCEIETDTGDIKITVNK